MHGLTRFLKNAGSLLSLGIVDRAASFVLAVVAARALSQRDFGTYSLVQAFLVFGTLLVSFGIDYVVVRTVSQDRSRASRLLTTTILVMLATALFAWVGIVAVTYLLHYPADVRRLATLAGSALLATALSQACAAFLKALERMEILALVTGSLSLIFAFLGIVAVFNGLGLDALVWLLVLKAIADGAILLYIVHHRFVSLALHWDLGSLFSLFWQGFPMAVLVAYNVLLSRLDIVLLGRLQTLDDVGIYGAVGKLTDLLALVGTSLVSALFPMLSARWQVSRDGFRRLYQQSLSIFSIFGFPIAFGMTMLARPVLQLLFGEAYMVGEVALALLVWAYLFRVIGGSVGLPLIIVGDRLGKLVSLAGLVIALNLGLNLLLIPYFSYEGAAVVALLCSIANFGLQFYLVRDYFGTPIRLDRAIVRPLLAAVVMSCILLLLPGLHVLIRVLLGGLVYVVALAALGEFKRPQYRSLQQLLGSLHRSKS